MKCNRPFGAFRKNLPEWCPVEPDEACNDPYEDTWERWDIDVWLSRGRGLRGGTGSVGGELRGKRQKLDTSPDVQLPIHILQMRLHRLGADAELCGDLVIRHPMRCPDDDLVLSVAQDI
jgi:hypothetical protein